MISINLNRVRGKIVELLGVPMDWDNYNYIVETKNCITTYWLKETFFKDGRFPSYNGTSVDRLTGKSYSTIIIMEDPAELPKTGYRVYDPTKKELLKRVSKFTQ